MQDFDLYLPTHIVFGKGRVAELGKLTTGRGERVLITYGAAASLKADCWMPSRLSLQTARSSRSAALNPIPRSER